MALPLQDRSSHSLYPRPYRWLGGDAIGSVQSASDVREGISYRPLTLSSEALEAQRRQQQQMQMHAPKL